MMWKSILLSPFVFSLFFSVPLRSETPVESSLVLLELADHLQTAEQYDASITEYWRFLFFHPDHPLAFYAYYKAAKSYSALSDRDTAISLLRRALRLQSSNNYQPRIRYQLALTYIANQDYDIAELELFKLSHSAGEDEIAKAVTFLLALLRTQEQKWKKAQESIEEAIRQNHHPKLTGYLEQIRKILDQPIQTPQKKSPSVAKWLSTFLPGSGQIYSGRVWDGFNAFALNFITSYLIWDNLQEKRFRDASLIFWFVWLRYYKGNRMHAEEAAIRVNQSYTQAVTQQIYQLFNQASRFMSEDPLGIKLSDLRGPTGE
jgi:hypothetical protein